MKFYEFILHESFTSNIDVGWQKTSWGYLGTFKLEDDPYSIEFRSTLVHGLKSKKAAEISFYRQDIKGDNSFASTKTVGHAAIKVYGVVYNAMIERYNDFDAFYFTAESQHSDLEYNKKVNVYTTLAYKVFKTKGDFFYVHKSSSSFEFLISKIETDDKYWIDYHSYITEAIDWSKVSTISKVKL